MDPMNDKLSIKNLLFTKAIPNYVVPTNSGSHKVYPCTDCGDKFLFPTSYDQHVNRKSVKITYCCRNCNEIKTFYNRCNLLAHIRSHAFKTATINVSDLKLEPLPLSFFSKTLLNESLSPVRSSAHCIECREPLTDIQSRARHYMQHTSNENHTCPICLFIMPTMCALKTHLRLHVNLPPYFCPECGLHLGQKCQIYPYNHNCEGFRMMRATARLKCPGKECPILHPSEFKEHFLHNHVKLVYKCPYCYLATYEERVISRHMKNHQENGKPITFHQCQICNCKLLTPKQLSYHLKAHTTSFVYPCWVCSSPFTSVQALIKHHEFNHELHDDIKKWCEKITIVSLKQTGNTYRVIKRCDQCNGRFAYKCNFAGINKLPDVCPNKCTPEGTRIKCPLCDAKVSQKWIEVQKHFKDQHKTHRCLSVKLALQRIDISKYLKKGGSRNLKKVVKRRKNRNKTRTLMIETVLSQGPTVGTPKTTKVGEIECKKCGQTFENKELLRDHLITHKDSSMAYQCMECGQCFAVKPSFSKHLLIEHDITEADIYIAEKKCYNETALMKYQNSPVFEPVKENQCGICREQFGNLADLEKHFRVHGMAFLKKNNGNKSTSP